MGDSGGMVGVRDECRVGGGMVGLRDGCGVGGGGSGVGTSRGVRTGRHLEGVVLMLGLSVVLGL